MASATMRIVAARCNKAFSTAAVLSKSLGNYLDVPERRWQLFGLSVCARDAGLRTHVSDCCERRDARLRYASRFCAGYVPGRSINVLLFARASFMTEQSIRNWAHAPPCAAIVRRATASWPMEWQARCDQQEEVGMNTFEREKSDSDAAPEVNIDASERMLHLAGGSVLLGLSVMRANPVVKLFMAATGGVLVYQGLTGYSPMYQMAGINTAKKTLSRNLSVPQQQGIHVAESVVINQPVSQLYAYWRNFENLPRIMKHLESVTMLDERRSHWKAKAPAGTTVEWNAQIINERPDEVIGWSSLPGAQIPNAGSVRFRPLSDNSAEVKVQLEYTPPAGPLGAAVAKLLGEEPSLQICDDLRRFKQIMESENPQARGWPAVGVS